MQARLVTGDPSPALVEEWRALHRRAARYPFTDPGFFQAWWLHCGRQSGQTLHIMTVHAGDRLLALAPHAISRRRGIRVLRWAGIDEFCYGDALAEDPAAEDALWHAIRRSGRYEVALVSRLGTDCSTYSALNRFSRLIRTDSNYVLDVAWPTGEAWLRQSLSPHARKHYRNMENQIRARAPLAFRVAPPAADRDRVLAALIRQKTAWAAARDMPGLFRHADAAGHVVRHLAQVAEANGTLFLSWLEAGDAVIAAILGMTHGSSLYLLFISYDAAWAKQSPGRLLLCKTLAHAIDQGVTRIDLMNGGQEYKQQLAQLSEHDLADFTFPGSMIGKLVEPVLARVYFPG